MIMLLSNTIQRVSRLLCLAGVTCLFASTAIGQTAKPSSGAKSGAVSAPSEIPAPAVPAPIPEDQIGAGLAHRVERLKKAFLSGDEFAIQGAMQEVDQYRRAFGTMDLLPLLEGMSLWARHLGNTGQTDLGLKVVRTLEPWAPRHPTLLGTRVILLRQQGIQGYVWSLSDVLVLNRLRWDHKIHRWLYMVQHFAWLRFMATVLLWGWALTLALRYRRVFRHLWEDPLREKGVSPNLVAVAGALLLSMPVLLGLDPSLVAFFWLWLLVPFLGKTEFRLSLALVFLQLVHPALALMEPKAGQEVRPSLVDLQLQPQHKPFEALGARYLGNADQAFLKGWQQMQAQQWPEAEATFRELGDHPDRAAVLNNLGVAQYQQGQVDAAAANFDEAFRMAPQQPEILVNQSVIAFGRLDPVLGVGKQEEARLQNPVVFDRLMQASKAGKVARAFPVPLPDTPARAAALATILDAKEEGHLLKLPPLAGLILSTLLPLMAAALIFLRLNRSVRQAHPAQCIRCGDPFHTTDSPDPNVCSKCHHLFILKDGLHGESRLKKLDEVAEFQASQRWIHRALILLLPGMDQTFVGKTRQGFQEFVFLTFALGLVLATGRSVRYPGEILMDPTSTWLPIGLVLLGVLFLRSWLKLTPSRS